MLVDQETLRRFWSKVDVKGEDDCWLWTAATSTVGKSVMGKWSPPRYTDLSFQAVRAAWQLTHGYISKKIRVAHLCPNTLCCNPKHLTADTTHERFWRKVDKTPGQGIGDCWMWTARVNAGGYGNFRLDPKGNQSSASRISYIITYGEIDDNAYVCHRCDNRACVNPSHLFLGNQSDNLQDMVMKRRGMIGETNKEAKLTESQVENIKKLLEDKIPQSAIAEQFGVTQSCISLIATGKNWRHLDQKKFKQRKLSEFQEEAVVKLLAEGVPQSDIATQYRISQATVSKLNADYKEIIKSLRENLK